MISLAMKNIMAGPNMKKLSIFCVMLLLAGCTRTTTENQDTLPSIGRSEKPAQNHISPDKCDVLTEKKAISDCIKYQELKEEVKSFFDQYPAYLNSNEMESKLLSEFNKQLKEPKNKNASIYEIISIAHDNLLNE